MKKLIIVSLSVLIALAAIGCTAPSLSTAPAPAPEAAVIPQEPAAAVAVPSTEAAAEAPVPVAEPATAPAPEAAPASVPAPASAAAPATETAPASDIGLEAAKQAAFTHAGLSAADVAALTYVRGKQDREDGRLVYEIDFVFGNTEYEYEIDSATGSIVSFDNDIADYDMDDYYEAPAPAPAPAGQSAGSVIGEDKAKAIVAGRVPGASASDVRLHLDYDDGRQVYEGELVYNNWEYEFELDAATGDIREWDAEAWDGPND